MQVERSWRKHKSPPEPEPEPEPEREQLQEHCGNRSSIVKKKTEQHQPKTGVERNRILYTKIFSFR
jgi:hypothetical protein